MRFSLGRCGQSKLLNIGFLLMTILITVLAAKSQSEEQNYEQVCIWNQESAQCEKNTSSLTALLRKTDHPIALMMTCQYITNEYDCDKACVWDNSSCHISSTYMLDTLLTCRSTSPPYSSENNRCQTQLQNIVDNHDWIDYDIVKSASDCQNSFSNNFFDLYYSSQTCIFIDHLNCCMIGAPFYYVQSQYYDAFDTHDIGKQFLQDVRFLMNNDLNQPAQFSVTKLEGVLQLSDGSLQRFSQCSQQLDKNKCENIRIEQYSLDMSYSDSSKEYGGNQEYVLVQEVQNDNDSGVSITLIIVPISAVVAFVLILVLIRYNRKRFQVGDAQAINESAPSVQQTNEEYVTVTVETLLDMLPDVTHQQIIDKNEILCTICLENFCEGEKTTVLECAHWFHLECIQKWITLKGVQAQCPLCNHKLSEQ